MIPECKIRTSKSTNQKYKILYNTIKFCENEDNLWVILSFHIIQKWKNQINFLIIRWVLLTYHICKIKPIIKCGLAHHQSLVLA